MASRNMALHRAAAPRLTRTTRPVSSRRWPAPARPKECPFIQLEVTGAVGAARLGHTRMGSASFIPTPREQQSLGEKEADAIGTPTTRRCNLWLSQSRLGM